MTTEDGWAAPKGFEPAIATYCDPLAKMTELRLVVPNALPENAVPAVNTDPLWKVMALASTAVNLWAAVVNVIAPLMLPVAPAPTAIVVKFVATLRLSAEPALTERSVPAPPAIVRV